MSFLLPVGRGYSQDEYAAVLRVMETGVEIKRVDAQNWLPVAKDAELPFGIGDTLRTNPSGRVYLTIRDVQILVLPGASFTLVSFVENAAGQLAVEVEVEGRAFFQVPPDSELDQFGVGAGRLNITEPAELFGVQHYRDEPAYLIVAQGGAQAELEDETLRVVAGAGLRADQDIQTLNPLPQPLNVANMENELYGCAGVVDTINNLELRVRSVPYEGFYTFGAIPNGSSISLIGQSQNGRWNFAHYGSTFGWVLALAVDTECDLPKIPDDSFKDFYGASSPQDFELQMLNPFYGSPQDDPFFYRDVIR